MKSFDETKMDNNSLWLIRTIILQGLPENSKEDSVRNNDSRMKVDQLRRIKSELTFCTEL